MDEEKRMKKWIIAISLYVLFIGIALVLGETFGSKYALTFAIIITWPLALFVGYKVLD